jgi:hypothetical protein
MEEEVNHYEELGHLVEAVETGVVIHDPKHLNESRYMDVPAIGNPLATAEQMIHAPGDYGLTEAQVGPYGTRLNNALKKYDVGILKEGVI